MRRIGVALLVWVLAALSATCGAKRPDPKLLAAEAARRAAELRATAETRVLQGCYDCLLEARAAYEQIAEPVRLFEVELLIALREKELGLDSSAALARARTLAPRLPPTLDAARYLRAVESIPTDETGLPVANARAFRRTQVEYAAGIDAELVWILADEALQLPVRQYVSLALDCSYLRRGRPPALQPIRGQPAPAQAPRQMVANQIPADAPAVVQFRVGICDAIRRAPLERIRKDDPRYAEAAYFLARLDIARASETGAPSARPLLAEAYGRFPNSPAVTYLAANYNQLIGDCKAALKYYDETIVIQPTHDNALLGRTMCLANLKRFDEAVSTATRMIEIPSSSIAEAYYWRAWIRHYLKDLVQARSDIEQAKRMLSNNEIHRLAGIIEFDQDDLPASEKDLTTAKSMYNGEHDCVSRWYLGLLDMKRERWTLSAANFEDAMSCYDRAAQFAEDGLRKMIAAENVDPDFKARQIAGFEAAIKEDRSQQFASAFNAANHYARGGNPARAKTLLEVAAKDPALEKLVADLRKILGGGWP